MSIRLPSAPLKHVNSPTRRSPAIGAPSNSHREKNRTQYEVGRGVPAGHPAPVGHQEYAMSSS